MAQKETPTPQPDPQPERAHPVVERAERIRKALGVEAPDMEWKTLLERIAQNVKAPEDADLTAEEMLVLDRKHRLLAAKRQALAQYLLAVLALAEEGRPMPEIDRTTALRLIAEYLDGLDAYDHDWRGAVRSGVRLPKYLADIPPLTFREGVALDSAKIMLPLQYDVLDRFGTEGKKPGDLAPQAFTILLRAARSRSVTMADILPCLDGDLQTLDDAPYRALLARLGYTDTTPEHLQAVKLIVGYIAKNRSEIEKYATSLTSDGTIEAMTITDALECCVRLPALGKLSREIALQAQSYLTTGTVDIAKAVRSTFSETPLEELYPQRLVQLALEPITALDEGATPEEKQKHMREVMRFFFSKEAEAPMADVERYIGDKRDAVKRMIRELCDRVATDQTLERVRNALLIPANADELEDMDTRVLAAFTELLLQRQLRLRDALQVYYLASSEGGDTVPLSLKALDILRTHDEFLANDYQVSLIDRFAGLAKLSAEELRNRFGDLRPGDRQLTELQNLSRYLKDEGVDELYKITNQIYWAHCRQPWLFLISGPTVGAAGYSLFKAGKWAFCDPAIKYNMGTLDDFAHTGIGDARRKFKIPLDVPDEQIAVCRDEIRTLIARRDMLRQRYHLFRRLNRKTRLNANGVMKAAKNADLGTVARYFKKVYPDVHDLTRVLQRLAPNERSLIDAVSGAGFEKTAVREAILELETSRLLERANGVERLRGMTRVRSWHRFFEEEVRPFMRRLEASEGGSPELRRALARRVLGAELSDERWQIIVRAHGEADIQRKFRILTELIDDFENLPTAEQIAQTRKIKRLMQIGLVGKEGALVEALPRTLDELRGAVRASGSYDDAVRIMREFVGRSGELDVNGYRTLIQSDHLDDLARAAGRLDDLAEFRRATEAATKAARRARLLRGGGILAGAGLAAFGVFVDGYLMVQTSRQIEDAEKRGDRSEAAILRSRWYSQAGEAGFGATTGTAGLFGALSGPAGWTAMSGLILKNAASETLYQYALEANRTRLGEYLKKHPEELMGLLHGRGDWPLEGPDAREFRHRTALEAYLLRTQPQRMTRPDERYLGEYLVQYSKWKEKDTENLETRETMVRVLLQEKNARFARRVAEFLEETGGIESPDALRLEQATTYASLKVAEHAASYVDGSESPAATEGQLSPQSFFKAGKETELSLGVRKQKAKALLHHLTLIKILEENGEMQPLEARVTFLTAAQETLLQHDAHLFLSRVAGRSAIDRYRHETTLQQIVMHELGALYEFDDFEHPDHFVRRALDLQERIREFLAKGLAFSARDLDTQGSPYGPPEPRWKRRDFFGTRKTS